MCVWLWKADNQRCEGLLCKHTICASIKEAASFPVNHIKVCELSRCIQETLWEYILCIFILFKQLRQIFCPGVSVRKSQWETYKNQIYLCGIRLNWFVNLNTAPWVPCSCARSQLNVFILKVYQGNNETNREHTVICRSQTRQSLRVQNINRIYPNL